MDGNPLADWFNLIFVVPFGLALAYLAVYTVSGVTFGDDLDVGGDADLDADAGAGAGAEVGDGHDVDLANGVDLYDPDADDAGTARVAGGTSALWAMLSWLGVGRVPASVALMVALLTWGGIGFAANQIARPAVRRAGFGDAAVAVASVPLAFAGSVLCTRVVSRVVGKYLPTNETYASTRRDLLGRRGEAVLGVGADFGLAVVRDVHGTRHQVPCRLADRFAGDPPLRAGSKIILVGYDSDAKLYRAAPDDLEAEGAPPRASAGGPPPRREGP